MPVARLADGLVGALKTSVPQLLPALCFYPSLSRMLPFAPLFPACTASVARVRALLTFALGLLLAGLTPTAAFAAPNITGLSAKRQVLAPGQNTTLSVTATGEGAVSYQWIHNGLPRQPEFFPPFTRNYQVSKPAPARRFTLLQ